MVNYVTLGFKDEIFIILHIAISCTFIEKTIFSSLNDLDTRVKNQLTIDTQMKYGDVGTRTKAVLMK